MENQATGLGLPFKRFPARRPALTNTHSKEQVMNSMVNGTINVKFHNFETLEQAQIEAQKAAANTAGQSFPMVLFRQGNRQALSGALPVSYVRSRLKRKSAEKKSGVV